MADSNTTDKIESYDDDGKPIMAKDEKAGEGDDKGSDSPKKEPKADEDKDEEEEEDIEIPVRNTENLQHIIARKNKKIEKLKSKIENKDDEEDYVPPTDDNEEEDDTGLSEEAQKAVDKTINKKLAPLMQKVAKDEEEKELKDLFTAEPEAKKYEKHIRAYMQHEAYKNVAPSVIFHHLAFSNSVAMGAKKKNLADKEARQNRSAGRSIVDTDIGAGDLPSADDISSMSEADFEKLEADVRNGKYIRK